MQGEAGLYAPRLAALAVKQAQGDTVEAAFLLRAYRSTLERWDETDPVDPDELFATRRVSPAYKDVPGGQVLGPTKDYTRRLLDFALTDDADPPDPTDDWDPDRESPEQLTNVTTLLREEGLLPAADGHETDHEAAAAAFVERTRERDIEGLEQLYLFGSFDQQNPVPLFKYNQQCRQNI